MLASPPAPALVETSNLPGARRRWPAALFVLVAVATLAAIWLGDGDAALALTPALLTLLVAAISAFPLRIPLFVLLALAWLVESPIENFANHLAVPPWAMIGEVLWGKLNRAVPSMQWLVFSGFDVLLVVFAAVIVYRHRARSRLDRTGWVDTPRPLGWMALLTLAALAWIALFGLATGGSFRFTLWQVIKFLYLPIVFLLMREGLRDASDGLVAGKILLAVGAVRAVTAIVLRQMFPSTWAMPHATTHPDSVLFATCIGIAIAVCLEWPTRRNLKASVLLVPLLLWAMFANNRRLVWAEVFVIALFFVWVTRWTATKRFVVKVAALSLLPLAVYAAAGWNSQAAAFFPVRTLRSMLDAQTDNSTRWREQENFNLVHTFTLSPLVGSGFGHPFVERVEMDDISTLYDVEPYVPHNAVLGIWAFGGVLGFSLLWLAFPTGLFFTVLAYRRARTGAERVLALGAAGAQIAYLLQGYGDLGFGSWGSVFTVACAYAVVGKLCVENGAWRDRRPAEVT